MTIFYLSIKGEAHCYVPSMKGNQDTLSGGLRVSPPTAWLRRDWRVCPGTPASNTVWSGNSPECLLCVRPLLGMGRRQWTTRGPCPPGIWEKQPIPRVPLLLRPQFPYLSSSFLPSGPPTCPSLSLLIPNPSSSRGWEGPPPKRDL